MGFADFGTGRLATCRVPTKAVDSLSISDQKGGTGPGRRTSAPVVSPGGELVAARGGVPTPGWAPATPARVNVGGKFHKRHYRHLAHRCQRWRMRRRGQGGNNAAGGPPSSRYFARSCNFSKLMDDLAENS